MKGARAGLVALGLAACARPAGAPTASPAAAPQVWSYEVVAGSDDLDVTATFSRGASTLSLEEAATPFVADLSVEHGDAPTMRGGVWTVPSCAQGCTVRYRFHLAEAARALDDIDNAVALGGCVEAPPSAWLLRPTEHESSATYRFHVSVSAPGSRFASGVRPVPGSPDTYGADADDLDTAPYSVFGPFRSRTLARKGARFELAVLPGKLALDDATLDHWISISAGAVEAYYGRFPVPRVLLVIAPSGSGRGETVEGRTMSSGGSSIFWGSAPR